MTRNKNSFLTFNDDSAPASCLTIVGQEGSEMNCGNTYVTFREHFCGANSIFDINAITDLFEYLGIGPLAVTDIVDTKYNSLNRRVLLVSTKGKVTNLISHVLIAIFFEKPTRKDMIEITYDTGTLCDKRIVIYDRELLTRMHDKYLCDFGLIRDFVKLNNLCGVDTYLLATTSFDYNEQAPCLRFRKDEYSMPVSSPRGILPSRQRMVEAEYLHGFYYSIIEPRPATLLDEHTSIKFSEETICPSKRNCLRWIMEVKIDDLKRIFGTSRVHIEKPCEFSDIETIRIHINDIPFQTVLNGTPQEKHEYAHLEYASIKELASLTEDLISEFEEKESQHERH